MSTSTPKTAIFLSYARDDVAAARRIAEALRANGLEVWFDENELRGGDAWDAKIRQQIDVCTLFVPLISRNTDARTKGYFRLEWKLAVDQTHLLAEGVPFIAPVVVDETSEGGAIVPPEFLKVQWTRLPGALPTTEFVAQIKRLLERKSAAPRVNSRGQESPGAVRSSRIGAGVWIAMAAVVVAGVVTAVLLAPNRARDPVQPEMAAASSKSPTTPNQVDQLIVKARALYEPWDLASREDLALADELLKRAQQLDPSRGDVWAHAAVLDCCWSVTNLDPSDERKAAARAHAERAFKLAPELPLARFARAFSLRFDPQTVPEAVRLLREEATRQPQNHMVVRTLGAALRNIREYEQSLAYLDKAAALPGVDPMTLNNRGQTLVALGRFAEAEAAFDDSLALFPNFRSSLSWKIQLALDYHNDLAEARTLLGRYRPEMFADENTAVTAALIWLYSRDGAKSLEALRPLSPYPQRPYFNGPKLYLTGLAHRLAGNGAASRTDWRGALAQIEQRFAGQANVTEALWWRAFLFGSLGEQESVMKILPDIRERYEVKDYYLTTMRMARLFAVLDLKDEAIQSARQAVQDASTRTGVTMPAGMGTGILSFKNELRYHPLWDALRSDPRLSELLKNPPTGKK